MATTIGTIPKPVRMNEQGVLRVGRSRVSLDSVVYAFNRGEDAAEIQRNFDTLTLAEVHAAIAYYLHNKAEVDEYLEMARKREDEIMEEIEREFPSRLTRETLLARKNGIDPDWNE